VAADAAAEDEVGLTAQDGVDEAGQVGEDVGAVAVHEDEDGRLPAGGVDAGEAGGAVAFLAGGYAGTGLFGDRGGRVGTAVVDDDALGDQGPGHLGDDAADGFRFVEGGDDDGNGRRHCRSTGQASMCSA